MFKFIFCLGLPFFGWSQIQVFFPKTSPKEHQRALITLANGQILSGSNEANIRLHKSNGQVLQNSQLGAPFKEIRDLASTPNGFIALQSHDSSGLVLLNKSLEIDTIIYPLQTRVPLFLDGICAQENLVFLLGDPIDGFFSTFRSTDGGLHWQATTQKVSASKLPYPSCPTCGPYAMAIKNEAEIMTVGGSYLEPNNAQNTCFYSKDGGLTWQAPKKGPSGYRSCVIHTGKAYYACGTNGIDVSKNGGKTWKKISNENALSMTFSNGQLLYVSLANGGWLVINK